MNQESGDTRRRLRHRLSIGTVGVTLRAPGTPAVGLGEVLLLPAGFAELLGRPRDKHVTRLTLAAVLWSIGSIASDLVNESSDFDLLRGQARIWLTLLPLLGARRIQRATGLSAERLVATYALAALLSAVTLPAPSFEVDPWKFGLAVPVGILALGAVRSRGLSARALTVIGLMVINFWVGTRSLGGVLLLVLVLQLFRSVPWRHRRGRITPLLIAVVLVLYGLTAAYERAVYAGVFGDQTEKFEVQLDGEIGLLSGRIGTIASLHPIADRPFVGWGTWAADDDLIETYLAVVVENHGPSFVPVQRPIRFPAHSYFLQSWLESGLAAVPFWLLAIGMAGAALRLTLADRSPPTSWIVLDFLAIKFFWDFAFSPFGAETRGLVVISLLVFLDAIDKSTVPRPVCSLPAQGTHVLPEGHPIARASNAEWSQHAGTR